MKMNKKLKNIEIPFSLKRKINFLIEVIINNI